LNQGTTCQPGLPDRTFSNQNAKFGLFLEGLAMEDVGISYRQLVYFPTIWYTLWTFGTSCGKMVHFPRFGMLFQEKSGNTATM
jgi:hypothetical protein